MSFNFNKAIREAAGRNTDNAEKKILQRADFSSDEAFLNARADEILRTSDPAREAALRQAKRELVEHQEDELRAAVARQYEAHKQSTSLSPADEEAIRKYARAQAEKEFRDGRISYNALASRTAEIANEMADEAVNEAVNSKVFNDLFRGKIELGDEVDGNE